MTKNELSCYRRINWPYCIQRLADGRFVVLNRTYKPLGHSNGFFDYANYAQQLSIDETAAQGLSFKGDSSVDHIWLYDDDTSPLYPPTKANLAAYLKRATLLASLGGPTIEA